MMPAIETTRSTGMRSGGGHSLDQKKKQCYPPALHDIRSVATPSRSKGFLVCVHSPGRAKPAPKRISKMAHGAAGRFGTHGGRCSPLWWLATLQSSRPHRPSAASCLPQSIPQSALGVLHLAVAERPVFLLHLDKVDKDILAPHAEFRMQVLGDASIKSFL